MILRVYSILLVTLIFQSTSAFSDSPYDLDLVYREPHERNNLNDIQVMAFKHKGEIKGFEISKVKKGSVLYKLGFRDLDLLAKVNGVELNSYKSSSAVFDDLYKKDKSKAVVRRNQEWYLITTDHSSLSGEYKESLFDIASSRPEVYVGDWTAKVNNSKYDSIRLSFSLSKKGSLLLKVGKRLKDTEEYVFKKTKTHKETMSFLVRVLKLKGKDLLIDGKRKANFKRDILLKSKVKSRNIRG